MKRTALISASFIVFNLGACVLSDKQVGDDEAAEGDTSDDDTSEEDPDTGEEDPDTGEEDPDTGEEDPETGEDSGDPCTDPPPQQDPDCDGLGLSCDNAVKHHNPDQLDQDNDDYGDVWDLCPLVASESNTSDSDKDGLGNACDRCKRTAEHYNEGLAIDDPRLWVRNVPNDSDFDQDGIGDVCDNCVAVANCHSYGLDNPAPYGADIDDGDVQNCQSDADLDGIGDACLGLNGPSAAGPVGFGPSDDFDQDGINNFEDACPRLAIPEDERLSCDSDTDCNSGARNGYHCSDTPANDGGTHCNHRDIDEDSVGDLCDTCPNIPNQAQITDTGMLLDDEDGDFVGSVCESNQACMDRADARRTGFYDLSAGGQCCVTTYPGDDVLHDPNGIPIRRVCSSDDQEAGICRQLPGSVAALPGFVDLPPGCGVAGTQLTLDDVGGDLLALAAKACLLPIVDHDFDGIGDACDLCPFAFDPFNEPYVDVEQGMLYPNLGAACNGEHSTTPGAMCELD
ncbi:MAG TPA: thrombospondin type 3 repeat-containing protein [Enhygromyxa sp.]|nr:thrombospondin type 3 repeat-containing protein [Enhygromyxa sp.]